jgi:hypothetical protein
MDFLGRSFTADISSLAPGLYIIEITADGFHAAARL